ncbi:MAG: hypothetical protein A3A86_05490 [Elusimicrobia bacterium RIFCSPLOWO2_01_FULL_60_11]|nr:MAG: hypothetical protein A3A86_05490 [Elusimicrobia bacterium RIFCSPLOWO2_01_FULL_60_11]
MSSGKFARLLILSLLSCLFTHGTAKGSGLTVTMGEVILRNLQPGSTYHLTSLLNFPLRLTYSGTQPIALRIAPVVPEPNEYKEGYEPIPDSAWVTAEPSQFNLEGSSTVESNVSIAIPDDESLRGRKFIAYLWSQTSGEGKGLSLGLGAKSRLLLSIATEKSTAPAPSPSGGTMDFELSPPAANLQNIRPGKKIAVNKLLRKDFFLVNTGKEERKFKLEKIPASSLDMTPSRGYEWGPEDTVIEVSPSAFSLKAGKRKKFNVKMRVPDRPAHYGKHYQYLLRATPQGAGVSSGILFRINLDTRKGDL